MFSELPTHPSHNFKLSGKQELPAHVMQGLGRYRTEEGTAAAGGADALVTGSHRHKYFKRAIVPFMQAVPPEVCVAGRRSRDGGPHPRPPGFSLPTPILSATR